MGKSYGEILILIGDFELIILRKEQLRSVLAEASVDCLLEGLDVQVRIFERDEILN